MNRRVAPVAGQSLVLAWMAAGAVVSARAADVQVAVMDAAGKPLADAVVFLESTEAQRQVQPLAVQEMSQ